MSVENELMLFGVLCIVIGIMILYCGLSTANEFEYYAKATGEWAKEELDKRKQMEAATIRKNNRGEWVDKNGKAVNPAGFAAYCSSCGEWSEYLTPFCGWCGAEMAGFEEVEENDKTGSD